MFDLGIQELIVIFLVALLVFGPKKLPELGRTLGKWVIELKRGIYNAKYQMENELSDTENKPGDSMIRQPSESDNKISDDSESKETKENT